MTKIFLPKTFITRCEALQCDPKEVITELINEFLAEHPEKETPNEILLQNFIPPIVEALNESINKKRGPFRAKYYPPPNGGNTLWFHLTSVLSWWIKTYGEELYSAQLKSELQNATYITGPKAINIDGKVTWCYGFQQPIDQPIIPLPDETDQRFLEWTETSAPSV